MKFEGHMKQYEALSCGATRRRHRISEFVTFVSVSTHVPYK